MIRQIMLIAALCTVAAVPAQAGISVQAWGGARGQSVDLFTLTNARGMEARITNYGAVITAVRMPGRDGKLTNVVQGFDSLAEYTSQDYRGRYGAVIGRFANRIQDNTFRINTDTYRISRDANVLNDDKNNRPYDERVWSAETKDGAEPQLILSLIDPDGSMGYPGTLRVRVTYTLTRNNVLRLDYRARADKDTIVNLTNHAYFNMAGDASGSVLDQLLTVNADAITVGDDKNVPTGAMRKVEGTAFDFRTPTPIGKNINHPDPAIQLAKGFDQNYALNGEPGILRLAARLEDPKSGRMLEEWTTQPGLQVYSANYPPATVAAAKGYAVHSSVALEAQGFPNAPNVPTFPSTFLKQGDTYAETTEYRFIVRP